MNCSGNGQCVDGVNTFECACNPGFTGEFCQCNIDDCFPGGINCSVNGVSHCECSPGPGHHPVCTATSTTSYSKM